MVVCPPTFPSRVYLQKCTSVGRLLGQGVGRPTLCLSTPWRAHFCGCCKPWFLCPPTSVDLDQPCTIIHFSCNIFCSVSTFWSESGWNFGFKPDLFASCLRWFTPVSIGLQSGGTTEGFSHLYGVFTVIRIPRSGVGYGVGCWYQNLYRSIGWQTEACHGIPCWHHRSSRSFWRPTTFCVGLSHGLHTMVWIVNLCIALQRHHGDYLLSLGAEDFGQGAQRSTSIEKGIEVMIERAEQISRFKEHVVEELRVQQVYTAMASSPPLVVSSSHNW